MYINVEHWPNIIVERTQTNSFVIRMVWNPSFQYDAEPYYYDGMASLTFDGMTDKESEPLLAFLFRHQVDPEFICRFRWEAGSIAFWDNRCTLHNPINDYHGYRRRMLRITIAGDTPV